MTITLNFGVGEKKAIKKLFSEFELLSTKTKFEEARWRSWGCTVTLYSTGKLVIQGAKEQYVKRFILGEIAGEKEIELGMDEAGRGENFGALVIAGVLGDKNRLRELRDSKKTSNLKKKKKIVSMNALAIASVIFSPEFVDSARKRGISLNELQAKAFKAINFALNPESKFPVLVDGMPLRGCNGFKFLVKGDDLEPVIGAASIIAKSLREESENKGKRFTWKNS